MTIFDGRERIDNGGEEVGTDTSDRVDLAVTEDRLLAQLVTNSEPNRVAIIGEPGSGKTTCLQKLAAGLLDRELLPIWISLADLQGETLENYLLQDWLKIATRQINRPLAKVRDRSTKPIFVSVFNQSFILNK